MFQNAEGEVWAATDHRSSQRLYFRLAADQPLGRPKVAAEQGAVGVKCRHKCDASKIVPLGQHLRAHQNICRAAVRLRQLLFQTAGAFALSKIIKGKLE